MESNTSGSDLISDPRILDKEILTIYMGNPLAFAVSTRIPLIYHIFRYLFYLCNNLNHYSTKCRWNQVPWRRKTFSPRLLAIDFISIAFITSLTI